MSGCSSHDTMSLSSPEMEPSALSSSPPARGDAMAVAVLKIWAPSTFVCVSVYLPVQDIFLSAGQKVPGATKFPLNTRRIAGSESQSWGCVANSQSHLWINGQVYTAWHRLLLEFIRVMWQRLSNYDELCFCLLSPSRSRQRASNRDFMSSDHSSFTLDVPVAQSRSPPSKPSVT